ncbi:hypothetical protein Tco_0200778 [Tanacetum coccineum]
MESSNSNLKERELQLTQRLAKQRHSNCMTWFEQLETHLHDLYLLNSPYAVDAFKPAFRSFFGEEHQTFKLKMFHNLDQLRLQLERENLHGVNAKTCLQALRTQFKEFLASKGVNATDLLNQGWQQDFEDFTRYLSCNLVSTDVSYSEPGYRLKGRGFGVLHSVVNAYGVLAERKMKLNALKENGNDIKGKRGKRPPTDMREAVDAGLVVTESSGKKPDKQDISSSSGNYITQAVDHTEQSEPNYDTHLLETIDSNTTPTSTNMCHRGGKIDQDALVNAELLKTKRYGKPPLQPSRNHLVVRQPNAFMSERPRMSRPRFASQVDEKNDLSKTVTPHYLPKVRESAAANLIRKMTQDKTRIPNHRDMASTIAHCTPNACTPKPRNICRSSPESKCSGGMSNGQRFSLNKSSVVHEKPHTPRSCLRWKPTGRIFKTVSLRWIPTGKVFIDSTTKVDSEPPNGSNDDITNPYECNQTLYEFKEFKSDEHASNDVWTKQFKPRSSSKDVWTKQFRPRSSS